MSLNTDVSSSASNVPDKAQIERNIAIENEKMKQTWYVVWLKECVCAWSFDKADDRDAADGQKTGMVLFGLDSISCGCLVFFV